MKIKYYLQSFISMVLVLMTLSPGSVNAQSPQVLYVVSGGQISGVCDNWANACELQYALTSAISGQDIWVAAGVYKPGPDRIATFQLKSGVRLYGGFSGTEAIRDQRDWVTNPTILSGDIDNNDINDDGNSIAETTADIQGENAYHVVASSYTDNTAVLDGFIITAGLATDVNFVYPNFFGGGMYISESNPILTNIVFSANSATTGGGIFIGNGDPTLTNITFSSNLASYSGGGISNFEGDPTLTNVIFSSNSATTGGGMYNDDLSSPSLTNVLFSGNLASSGGGMYNSHSSPSLVNATFYRNSADYGGGMYNFVSRPTLMNITFFSNSASEGGGIYNYIRSSPVLINSIMWADNAALSSEIFDGLLSSSNITYSNVQGGWPGTGNIDADPMFVDPANGNLHLRAGSPAIDSGINDDCPATDLDSVSRPQDGNNDGIAMCDMGAFEFFQTPISVKIDIKPGSDSNPINLASSGVIPVAVLTTAYFDAGSLDPASVLFAGASPLHWSQQDVDGDGDTDFLFHFMTQNLILNESSTDASLTGITLSGILVEGTDLVKIVVMQ